MNVNRKIIFNHIPKTGGMTLRIILNRVYGPENIFLIRSKDIGASLSLYSQLLNAERERYKVVAGHGAELFRLLMDEPFRISILREPISLFISQYYYLRISRDSNYFNEVGAMGSIEEYLDYAIEKGQDNLLTRYLSGSEQFLARTGVPVPDMKKEGALLLAKALKALHEYDAVLDLEDFDAGIFALAQKLGWKKIPVYRQSNRNTSKPGNPRLSEAFLFKLRIVLKYDLELYDSFRNERLGTGLEADRNSLRYQLFQCRQKGIQILASVLRKK